MRIGSSFSRQFLYLHISFEPKAAFFSAESNADCLKPQKLVILGSTGSIGKQTLEIIREQPGAFDLLAVSGRTNWETLAEQIEEFHPAYALLCDPSNRKALEERVRGTGTKLLFGEGHLCDLAALPEADVILNSLVGYAGFEPTAAALKADKRVALANKESLVVGGELIMALLEEHGGKLIPVDSEHSAMLQCLAGESRDDIERIIITASGGPFRDWPPERMEEITVSDALAHPNWTMGAKITVDSATMMNKGLEIIEAHWLFGLPLSRIEAVVHPQSIIHSVVEFTDGSSKAQLGPPTMKVPILYALTWPDRAAAEAPVLNWKEAFDLTFEPVDTGRFPCMRLALEAAERGGIAPAILNASNEVAVQRFLNEEIPYIRIPGIIETCLDRLDEQVALSPETLKETDHNTRALAATL